MRIINVLQLFVVLRVEMEAAALLQIDATVQQPGPEVTAKLVGYSNNYGMAAVPQ